MKKQIIFCLVFISITFIFLSGCTTNQTSKEIKAKFEMIPSENYYRNDSLTFTNKSTGEDIVRWEWNFGDGSTSTLENPIHRFTEVGTYKVKLTVYNDIGDNDTYIENITIDWKPPVAKIIHPEEGMMINEAINLSDGSIPGDGNITEWIWDFGDGVIIKDQNPTAHIYRTSGQKTISLKITDEYGKTDTFTKTISIGQPRIL